MNTHQFKMIQDKQKIEALQKSSLKPDDIFANMDKLNEEIKETYKDMLEDVEEVTVEEAVEEDPLELPDPEGLDEEIEKELTRLQAVQAQKQKEAAKEVQKQPEISLEDQQRKAIYEALSKIPGAPNEAQIEGLKAKHGKHAINVLALGEEDIYIFTYLKRSQFEKITQLVQAAASSDLKTDADKLMKEKVVQYCVIWPPVSKLEFLYNSRAGVIDTLFQTIMLHSYFITPQQAASLTVAL